MSNLFQKFIFSTSTIASIVLTNVDNAHGTLITYDFDVSIDSGSLTGETYTGFFNYDDSGLTSSGEEFIPVLSLNFNFLGENYTKDDEVANTEVLFFDGELLGLSYNTDIFSVIPGFFDISESFFVYDTLVEGTGAGDILYSLRDSSASVPEPGSIFSLFALGIISSAITKKNNNKAEK